MLEYAVAPNGQYRILAAESLIGSVRPFYSVGAGNLIFSKLQLLAELPLTKLELKSELKTTLKYEKHMMSDTHREAIRALIDELTPQDFEGRYMDVVKKPKWDDDDGRGYIESIQAKTDQLAQIFLDTKAYESIDISILHSGEQQNGFFFGESLAKAFDENQRKYFFDKSVEALKKLNESERNFAVIAGFIKNQNSSRKNEFLLEIIQDPVLQSAAFLISSSSNPSKIIFEKLFDLVSRGTFGITEFIRFQYGRALDHLEVNYLKTLLIDLANYDVDGAKVSVSLVFMYSYNDKQKFDVIKDTIEEILLKRGLLLPSDFDLDKHKWGDLCEELLKGNNINLAGHLVKEIVHLCSGGSMISSIDFELKNILKILLRDYFEISWPDLNKALLSDGDEYITYYNLKNILGSHIGSFGSQIGVLFVGDHEELFNWCTAHAPIAPNRLVHMAPIFDESRPDEWHPFTLRLIDSFGNTDGFLSQLSANLGTFSWSGSLIPLLQAKRSLMLTLINHKYNSVREWAQKYLTYLDEEIRKESNQDIEHFL